MKKNKSDYIIAGAVIACSLVLLAALTTAIFGIDTPPRGGQWVEIDFPTVVGIGVNSQVRYAGAQSGKVLELRPLTNSERKAAPNPASAIRVKCLLGKDTPELGADVTAVISSDTILGDKMINLVPGSPSAPPLAPGTVILGQGTVDIDELTRQGMKALANADSSMKLISEQLPRLLPQIQSTLVAVESTLLNTDDLIKDNRAQLKRALEDLRVVMQNLKVVTTYAKTFTHTIAEKPSRIVWSGPPTKLPDEKTILEDKKPIMMLPPRGKE